MSQVQIRRCGIGLGSNVGDRLQNLRLAARAIDLLADFAHPLLRAPIFETPAEDCGPESGPFFNSVIEIGFYGDPLTLLQRLRQIELALGRPASRGKNEPRVIDLDLLYADDLEVCSEELELPHPRMCGRRFVLLPLAELRPHLRLPRQSATVRELLLSLPMSGPVPRLILREW